MPPTRRRYNQKTWTTIKNLGCATLRCPYWPFQDQKVRWIPMAKRSLENEGRHKSSKQKWQGYYHNQVATGWAQMAHGWTDCKYLNYFKKIFVDYKATWKRRYRYKVLFQRPWLQKIVNAEPWIEEVITNPLRMLSSVLGKNKEDNISLFRKMRDQGKDHSTMNWKRNCDGWVKIGWLISRNVLPLDHLRKIGGHISTNIDGMDTKTLNSEITNGKIINSKIMFGLKI